jgi:homoserine dehydrogenase
MTEMHRVPLIILGLGSVGRVLVRQILATREVISSRAGLDLNVVAVVDSQAALSTRSGLTDESLQLALKHKRSNRSLDSLADGQSHRALSDLLVPETILVDVTASSETVSWLEDAARMGCGLVLANKHPLAGDSSRAQKLLAYRDLRYETTVGAGLPVISTLRNLLVTGDSVKQIEGCMSGTLGYLCSQIENGVPYSTAVRQARSLGFTEPDPREDLSGRDVARKALILARTVGWALETTQLAVEALYSDRLSGVSTDMFIDQVQALDGEYSQRNEEAQMHGKVLRYVAHVDPKGGSVGLTAVEKNSLMGALRGPANYFAFRTERYAQEALIISGPGAGLEVTASGVLNDIIDLALHRSAQYPTPERH